MLEMVKKKVGYVLWAALFAYGIYSLTIVIFFNIAEQNAFYATIGNIVLIIIFVITEKVEKYIYRKVKLTTPKFPTLRKLYDFHMAGPSFKSAMYLFYIVIIVYSALIAANPDFSVRYIFHDPDYLLSVRYGALVLIAADKFMEQIFKDIKEDDEVEK